MDNTGYNEKSCARCGKPFIVHSEWAFKRVANGRKYFCSYKCMREWENERGSKAERRERIIQAINDGLTTNEIVSLLNVDHSAVNYWRRKLGNDD